MKDSVYREVIDSLKEERDCELFTVVSGENAGHRAVFSNGKWVLSHEEELPVFERVKAGGAVHGSSTETELGTVFTERILKSPRVCVCGGGHVSLPLVKMLQMLEFDVTVIDERPEFCNSERFPGAHTFCMDFEEGLTRFDGGANDYFVIITRGHLYDRMCLEHILNGSYAYVGMIGSRTKVRAVFRHMVEEEGYTEEQLKSVHSPIGLKIGANTPAEIALCIAAEIVSVKNSGAGDTGWSSDLVQALDGLSTPAAMAVIVHKSGSSPRAPGARMLVRPDGTQAGSVGGGDGEYTATHLALEVIESGNCGIYRCDMINKNPEDSGAVCGGRIDVFLERIE